MTDTKSRQRFFLKKIYIIKPTKNQNNDDKKTPTGIINYKLKSGALNSQVLVWKLQYTIAISIKI